MYTVYHLNATELNEQFLDAVKTLFDGKTIEITVSEVDETAYLFRSEANRQRLLEAIEHVNEGKNLVELQLDALE